MQWDSAAYLRFKAERTQPSIDLVKRIDLEQPRKLLDVGCGPGNSTQVLADAFPNALRIIGIDSSPEMIEAAKDDHPDMEFRICDALNLPSLGEDGFDVVFSNACIQWVPDHPRLIRDMLALLRPGGMLAVQVPMNYQEPIHRIIGELAASDEWRAELASARIFHTLSQEAYFDILAAEAGQFQIVLFEFRNTLFIFYDQNFAHIQFLLLWVLSITTRIVFSSVSSAHPALR